METAFQNGAYGFDMQTQKIIPVSVEPNELIANWVEGFLIDCKAHSLSSNTVRFQLQIEGINKTTDRQSIY